MGGFEIENSLGLSRILNFQIQKIHFLLVFLNIYEYIYIYIDSFIVSLNHSFI